MTTSPPGLALFENDLHHFLKVCENLGFAVATEKVEGPSMTLNFLGLELDSIAQRISSNRSMLQELQLWLHHRRKVTKQKLLSLISKLAFAARTVPAGRLFLYHLISLSTKAKRLHT
jgi:hypothetical protein